MQYVTPLLWLLGLAFVTLAWLGVILSVSMLTRGFISRAGHFDEGALEGAQGRRPFGVWGHGLIAGVIGYAIIVLFYAVLNLAQGRNLFATPSALGRSILGIPAQGTGVEIGPLLIYNALHLVVFLALGLAAAWLLQESGRHPKIWYLALVLLVAVFFHLVGVVMVIADPAGGVVPSWSVVAASAAAALAMGTYLLVSQPRILQAIRTADLES